ncbi:imelysin family protein [Wenyingzhuangia aestuarii]|uniref:imelysin family protein n=1 Tax=Wenyingzhuangia aestuarii TaxID=1647582 RepID=UPI00143C5FD3|nr:imelysin family protein [Wenyingzhuangia aestuarii]NJB84143.1 hypothetical protein [Wenyingzhuangia aestuarii]
MKKLLSLLAISVSLFSCVKENNTSVSDNFNRTLVLTNWVYNLAIPAFEDFNEKIALLEEKSNAFISSPDGATQGELQIALFNAQKSWQHVAMFELQGTTRIYMNTYPIDRETSTEPFNNSNEDDTTLAGNLAGTVADINAINFVTTSGTIDEQGFAALDYLINNENALTQFTEPSSSDAHKAYLSKVVDRMVGLADNANTYWTTNASSIIQNSGRSATASFDLMLNDYTNYIEQGFRENKIATPSGKRDNIKNAKAVESYYSSEHSKELFEEAFKAVQNFYDGTSYDGTSTGAGLKTYLDYLNATAYVSEENKDINISKLVENKFTEIETAANDLDADFVPYIESLEGVTPATKMFTVFNEIHDYVLLLKNQIFPAINVIQDYQDSDGD